MEAYRAISSQPNLHKFLGFDPSFLVEMLYYVKARIYAADRNVAWVYDIPDSRTLLGFGAEDVRFYVHMHNSCLLMPPLEYMFNGKKGKDAD